MSPAQTSARLVALEKENAALRASVADNQQLEARVVGLEVENAELRAFKQQMNAHSQEPLRLTLPMELWYLHGLDTLPVCDFLCFAATCRKSYSHVDNKSYWRDACLRGLGLGSTPLQPEDLEELPVRNWRRFYVQAVGLRPRWEGAPGVSGRCSWGNVPRPLPRSLRSSGPDCFFVEVFVANAERTVVSTRIKWACVPLDIVDWTAFPDSISIPLGLVLPGVTNEDPHFLEVRVVAHVDGALVPIFDSPQQFVLGDGNDRAFFFNGGTCTRVAPICNRCVKCSFCARGEEHWPTISDEWAVDLSVDCNMTVETTHSDCILKEVELKFDDTCPGEPDSQPLLHAGHGGECTHKHALLPSGVAGFRQFFQMPSHAYALHKPEAFSDPRRLSYAVQALREAREAWKASI